MFVTRSQHRFAQQYGQVSNINRCLPYTVFRRHNPLTTYNICIISILVKNVYQTGMNAIQLSETKSLHTWIRSGYVVNNKL